MIRVPRGARVWARSGPTDLRKGFAGLAGVVQTEMGHDLLVGDLFLFISRNRRLVKVLQWDGTGLCLYSKRLGRGLPRSGGTGRASESSFHGGSCRSFSRALT